MINKFVKFAQHHALINSKKIILLALSITIFIGSGIRFILLDDNVMNMLPNNIESKRVWEDIVQEFKYSDFLFVVFGTKGQNVLTKEKLAIAWNLTKSFELIKQVEEVISISTINRIDNEDGFLEVNKVMSSQNLDSLEIQSLKDYLNNNSNLSSQIISKNKDYISIIIRPKNEHEFSNLVSSVKEITKPYEALYEFHYGGQPYIAGTVPQLIQTETRKLMLLGLFIMSIILLINLRNFSAVCMILLLIAMSLVSMLGFLGWAFYFTNSKYFFFSFINSSMPIVLLTIANSDGVHMLSRFFREIRNKQNKTIAIKKTMHKLLLPIFLTSLTTSAAFLTMLTSPIPTMSGYGISIGFGILWAWILSSIFLPALINLKIWDFSSKAFLKPSILEKLVNSISKIILQYPKRVLSFGIIILFVSSFGIPKINVEVNLINLFKPGNIIRESTMFLDHELAGSMNLLIKVKGDIKDPKLLNQMIIIQDYLETIPSVNTTVSIANVVKEMHKTIMFGEPRYNNIPNNKDKINNLFTMYSLTGDPEDFGSLVNYEYNTGIITAMMHTISTREIIHLNDQINNFLISKTPNVNIEISGLMMFLKDFVNLVVQSSITSIITSIIVILCIIWIFFRQFKFGFLSIIPLISAVLLNFGLMGWFKIDLTHFTALLTAIIIGVGVDFSIHYISAYINHIKKNTSKNNITEKVINDVGYPILLDVFSNMAFSALIFSTLIPLVDMGGLMIFAMLSTSFGTLTILASIMEINKNKLYKINQK